MRNPFSKEKAQLVRVHDPEKGGPEHFPGVLRMVVFSL